jgi:hypothetical protein
MMLGIQKTAVQSDSMTDNEKLDAAEALVDKAAKAMYRGVVLVVLGIAALVASVVAGFTAADDGVVTFLTCAYALCFGCGLGEFWRSSRMARKGSQVLL